MTDRSIRGARREISEAGTSGAGAIGMRGLSDQATVFGNGSSCCNCILGAVTTVCEWFCAPGGTEIIGCAENSGSAFSA